MKKLIFLTVLLFGLFTQKIIAQSSNGTGGNTAVSGYYLGWSSGGLDLPFSTDNLTTTPMLLQNTTGYLGLGTPAPAHLLDVQGGDINVGCPFGVCSPFFSNSTGYMIGDQYVVWTNGLTDNIYLGIDAGGGVGTSPIGDDNTYVGYYAGYSAGTATGYPPQSNTLVGYAAGWQIQTLDNDTYIGAGAGAYDQNGFDNTFIGAGAGQQTEGGSSPIGDYNTFVGISCGQNNVTGYANSYYGKLAGNNNNGHMNCMYGGHSGDNNLATDSNAFFGTYSNYYGTTGQYNVYMGMDAALESGNSYLGYAPSNYNVYIGGDVANTNQSGNYNVVLGYKADAYISGGGSIYNSVAIGAEAVVLNNNQFILGNNS